MAAKRKDSEKDNASHVSDPEKIPSVPSKLQGLEDPDAGLSDEERAKIVRAIPVKHVNGRGRTCICMQDVSAARSMQTEANMAPNLGSEALMEA